MTPEDDSFKGGRAKPEHSLPSLWDAFVPKRQLSPMLRGAVLWAMYDEDRPPVHVTAALERLPARCGVLFRTYRRPEMVHDLMRAAYDSGRPVLAAVDSKQGISAALRAEMCIIGVHVPSRAYALLAELRRIKPEWALTCAAHDAAQIALGCQGGADAAFYSPVFPTRTHAGAPGMGLAAFRAAAEVSPLPLIALGGVKAVHLPLLAECGAAGAAGIDLFFAPEEG